MKYGFIGLLIGLPVLLAIFYTPVMGQDAAAFAMTTPGANEIAYLYLGFSGVLIRTANETVAIDPANLLIGSDMEALKKAGLALVLYTHGHGDHFALPTAVEFFEATGATIAAEPSVAGKLEGKIPADKLIGVAAGKSFKVGNISVDVVEGVHVGPIMLFRIGIGGTHIFHAGDSNYVPLSQYPSDLAFLPTGRPSPTASPDAAFRMASDLGAKSVVVFHGSNDQHTEFKKKMKTEFPDAEVVAAEAGKTAKISLKK